jgi:serine/threonine protein kinase/tetratricopeptide (TPR) repeat protein
MDGKTVSHYRILEKLGGGGMGVVYKAEDTHLHRHVALKFLPEHFAQDRQALERFKREARAASALSHPNICVIHDLDEYEGQPFIAMEFLEGRTLKQELQNAPLPIDQILNIGAQVAAGLEKAHARGIIHRDVKPANIFITRDGYAKILDFGLAKLSADQPGVGSAAPTVVAEEQLTSPGTAVGTVSYMSPEQVKAVELDARTDLFSLGVVLYEMATKKLTFTGSSSGVVFNEILSKSPTSSLRINPDLPDALDHIIGRALEKDPKLRYQTAADMKATLERLRRDSDLWASLIATPSRPQSDEEPGAMSGTESVSDSSDTQVFLGLLRRHKLLVGVGVVLAVVLVALAVRSFIAPSTPVLTEEDEILITDFVNTTGDEVFDGALKAALKVKLDESPFINVVSDTKIQETLRYMERGPEARITPAIGREVCQRLNNKAVMIGEIAQLGDTYLITLNAENCQTGESVASEQAEATGKDGVLGALDGAANSMRRKLGETLASIEETSTPLEQATTSSLEALKVLNQSYEMNDLQRYSEAVALARRAVNLDPNFAMAHSALATFHWNQRDYSAARHHAQRAFELRDRASEYERFDIEETYHSTVTENVDKFIETLELATRMYPNDASYWNNLANAYTQLGQLEKALETQLVAVRLSRGPLTIDNLADRYLGLGRIAEAKALLEQAISDGMEGGGLHRSLYVIAFLEKDEAAKESHAAWLEARHTVPGTSVIRINEAALHGRFKESRRLLEDWVTSLKQRGREEAASTTVAFHGIDEVMVGNREEALGFVSQAMEMEETNSVTRRVCAWVLAAAGEFEQARELMDVISKELPESTMWSRYGLPGGLAIIDLEQGAPEKAFRHFHSFGEKDLTAPTGTTTVFLRGRCLLEMGRGEEAAAGFRMILDHPFIDTFSINHALAHVGLARAKVLMGDKAGARKSYQDFLALWKDADPDIPILLEARAEYAELTR